MAIQPGQRRLAAILAADVAEYTRLMEEDTDGTVEAWQAAREDIIKPVVAGHSGNIVKLTGDGFLVEFPTVQEAVNCAIALQDGLAASSLEFRMGVNLGDIIDDGEDIHGEGVNIAARLEGLAEPGGICISGGVLDQVRNRINTGFRDLGEKTVKHVSTPIRVYSIDLMSTPGTVLAPDSSQLTQNNDPAVTVMPYEADRGSSSDGEMSKKSKLDQDLKLSGVIVVFIAPGLTILGLFTDALQPMLGVSALMAFLGAGLWAAGKMIERANQAESRRR